MVFCIGLARPILFYIFIGVVLKRISTFDTKIRFFSKPARLLRVDNTIVGGVPARFIKLIGQ